MTVFYVVKDQDFKEAIDKIRKDLRVTDKEIMEIIKSIVIVISRNTDVFNKEFLRTIEEGKILRKVEVIQEVMNKSLQVFKKLTFTKDVPTQNHNQHL